MPHSVSLIHTIAAALGLALALGFLATRLRLPALVGYLLAGVAIGPFTPGFVADAAMASQLAEIGVMLLMFGVGLHFSLGDLLAVRKIAVPGAVVQMMVATALGMALATWWGWGLGGALVFGLALSVASTVVLLRALETLGILDSHTGRIAVGWLVVEDLAMVLVLVLLPPLAGWLGGGKGGEGSAAQGVDGAALWQTLGWTLLQVGGFVALMLLVGAAFAGLAGRLLGRDSMTLFLAYMPGAIETIAIVAFSGGLNVVFILTHHLSRMVLLHFAPALLVQVRRGREGA